MSKKILIYLLALSFIFTLSACSGGGGGGSSSGGTSLVGSATYDTLSYASQSNVCFKASGSFGNAGSCTVAGTPSSQFSDATCSSGTKTAICTVGSRVFSLSTSGGVAEDTACSNAGGSISVTCPIAVQAVCTANSGIWTAPTSPDTSTPTNCSAQGGTYYTTLNRLIGSFSSQDVGVGTNRITASPTEVATAMSLFNGASDLDNTNINLVTMTASLTIDNKWSSAIVMTPSIYNMTSSAVELDVVAGAETNTYISINSGSVVLYYY